MIWRLDISALKCIVGDWIGCVSIVYLHKKHTHLFGIPVESFIHLADEMAKVLGNCYYMQ